MNKTLSDVHAQFASFFPDPQLPLWAWYLSRKMEEGNICVTVSDRSPELLNNPFKIVPDPSALKNCSRWVARPGECVKPFVLDGNRLYLHRYFRYETFILDSVKALLLAGNRQYHLRQDQLAKHSRLVEELNATGNTAGIPEPDRYDWQLAAALRSFLHNFSIITGGPGTGKTTTVAKLLKLLFTIDPAVRVALAAPTGKAAMRMAESLRQTTLPLDPALRSRFEALSPATLHRLLGVIKDSIHFRHNRENPLPYDVVIVDEASMIDVTLFAKLLEALHPDTRLVLLGDRNQLASVEAGSLLGDFCKCLPVPNCLLPEEAAFLNRFITDPERQIKPLARSGETLHPLAGHVTELLQSHRFTSQGGIGLLSRAIIRNETDTLTRLTDSPSDPAIRTDTTYSDDFFRDFIKGYAAYIHEPDIATALQKLNQLRVLVAVKEGDQGLYALNRKIEDYLRHTGLLKREGEFYQNRPIIVTRNNPDLDLYNGDVGILRRDAQGILWAWFADSEKGIRKVLPAYITDAETVFAMTIHKSQGSEFDQVLVVLPDQEQHRLLTRELLYTAVTRAKKAVWLQARPQTLLNTAAATVSRSSGIADRFR